MTLAPIDASVNGMFLIAFVLFTAASLIFHHWRMNLLRDRIHILDQRLSLTRTQLGLYVAHDQADPIDTAQAFAAHPDYPFPPGGPTTGQPYTPWGGAL